MVFGSTNVFEGLLDPLKPMIDPLIDLANAFVTLGEMIVSILTIFPKLLSLFTIFTDPIKVIKDIVFGISTGIYMIFDAVIDMLFGDIRRSMGISTEQGSNDGDQNSSKHKKCMPPSVTKLILLILCPPLALLLERGIHSILYVFICSILTYFYYFPGLIYASLYILC